MRVTPMEKRLSQTQRHFFKTPDVQMPASPRYDFKISGYALHLGIWSVSQLVGFNTGYLMVLFGLLLLLFYGTFYYFFVWYFLVLSGSFGSFI